MPSYGFAVMRTGSAVANSVVVVVDVDDSLHPGGVGVLPGLHAGGGIWAKAKVNEQSKTMVVSKNLIFIRRG